MAIYFFEGTLVTQIWLYFMGMLIGSQNNKGDAFAVKDLAKSKSNGSFLGYFFASALTILNFF